MCISGSSVLDWAWWNDTIHFDWARSHEGGLLRVQWLCFICFSSIFLALASCPGDIFLIEIAEIQIYLFFKKFLWFLNLVLLFFIRIILTFIFRGLCIMKFYLFLHLKCSSNTPISFFWGLRFCDSRPLNGRKRINICLKFILLITTLKVWKGNSTLSSRLWFLQLWNDISRMWMCTNKTLFILFKFWLNQVLCLTHRKMEEIAAWSGASILRYSE